jgi:hypothetical protein
MLGRVTVIQEDKQAISIQFDNPISFKMNQPVKVTEHKKNRSLSQNRLYWGYLAWIISRDGGGLIDQGHFSPDALHQDIKSWVQSEYPNQFDFKQIFSSAELNTKQFTDFIELIDRELMVSFFGINTNGFWGEVNKGDVPF